LDALSVDDRSAPNSSFKLEKAINEIGERTRILVHESVATAIELSKPSARKALTSFNELDGGITISAVPVAISTGRFISCSRFPTPVRCHASIAAA
jgi:hypothetical protein